MKIQDRPRYYQRDGKPYPNNQHNAALFAWAKDMEDPKKKIVKQDNVGLFGAFWVSTVWLGLDHNFFSGKPIIFETMVSCCFPKVNWFACSDLDQDRYSTEKEALKGHEVTVALWSDWRYTMGHIWPHIKRQWDYLLRERKIERFEKEKKAQKN